MNLARRLSKIFLVSLMLLLSACEINKENKTAEMLPYSDEQNTDVSESEDVSMFLTIDGKPINVIWEDNKAVNELRKYISENDINVSMSMYGGFEQLGSLGINLSRDDKQINTSPGDIVLYSGNQIVIFFGTNSWSYTKLGKIDGLNQNELKDLLYKGDVDITLSKEKKEDIPEGYVLLNSGYMMPVLGLGTWTLNNEEAENSVYHALKTGMRLIDTARYYGNETGVGKGLRKAIDEGIVSREDVFITTKIYGGNYETAKTIIDDALNDLNVDYIDLLLIHQPGYDDEGVYKAMEEAVYEGKLHSIGISNYYTKEAIDEVLSFAEIIPAVIQNENHIYYQNTELQEYVKQYGIIMESWYPFGGRGHTQDSFNNDVIVELSKKHNKSSAQIIIRWHIQAGYVVIPGSSNLDHIAENYDVFDFMLSEDEMQMIYELDKQHRYENW